ncbi:Virus tail fiber assembly protein lambda gpK [Paraburkholderia tropica]|uniref:tail fiber assembly protein n=1 Tax=Paraburkholderia tropica TaxID=92647 RepID=UPI001CB0D776|nr:tail fiber assembly protein [Paraburkholderia tropica]CAG9189487.1 Virus tail fiber assembly protein lambda gpK [Paraburkholderia tropica]
MLIHQYNNATGAYIGSRLADPDPLNQERWLLPAFSTDMPLPARKRDEWLFFIDGAWVIKPDFRGQMLYRTENGEAAEILIPGISIEDAGLTATPRPSEMHVWEGDAWALDAVAVAAKAKADALAEFEVLMSEARTQNAGKSDAYAADLLTSLEIDMFNAWAAYQMALVSVVNGADFPAAKEWPAKPDPVTIAAQVDAESVAEASKQNPT